MSGFRDNVVSFFDLGLGRIEQAIARLPAAARPAEPKTPRPMATIIDLAAERARRKARTAALLRAKA